MEKARRPMLKVMMPLIYTQCPTCNEIRTHELIRIAADPTGAVMFRVKCSACEWLWWEQQETPQPGR